MKSLRLIYRALSDLVVRILPQYKHGNGYAFIVHPRDHTDVFKKYPFLKHFSPTTVDFILRHLWPVVVVPIENLRDVKNGRDIEGLIISIPLYAKQMMEDRESATRFIQQAAILARKRGANIIGLGALTASLSRGGLDLEKCGISVTTGRLYTSKNLIETSNIIVDELDLNRASMTVAIVGAAGSIGTATAQLFAHSGYKRITLIDLSSKSEHIKKLKGYIHQIDQDIQVVCSEDIGMTKEADLIIAVTNKHNALIRSENVKAGAVIIDDAQPSDVDSEVLKNRDDVLVLEGGAAHNDAIRIPFSIGLHNKGDVYSCLAEVMTLAAHDVRDDFYVGEVLKLNMDKYKQMESMADDVGFTIGRLQNRYKNYTDDDIARIKRIRHSRE